MPPNDKIRNYLLANLIYGLIDCFEKSELIWVSIYIYVIWIVVFLTLCTRKATVSHHLRKSTEITMGLWVFIQLQKTGLSVARCIICAKYVLRKL